MKIRRINIFNILRPVAVALILCALPAQAAAPGESCGGLFARVFAGPRIDGERYLTLSKTPVAAYFPDTEMLHPLPGLEVKGARVTEENLQKFRADFDELLDRRAAAFHTPARKLRAWLQANSRSGKPYPDLDAFQIEDWFKASGATLEDLQNKYLLEFAQATQPQGVEAFLRKLHPRELGSLGLTVARKIGGKGWGIISGAMVAGPVAGVLTSFFSAPLKPILESAEQSSNILFPDVAQAIQHFTSAKIKDLKSHMTDLASTTDTLDQYNLEGMDRKEAKAILDEFEDRYYKIFLRMSGFMPPFKRGGRDIIRDWLINQPLMMANHASTFQMDYNMNKFFLKNLEEKIQGRGGKPTAEEEQQLEEYRENMESAENRLAVTLASWKIYTFAFAEVARDPQVKEANATLMNTLGRYEKFMNMDKYRKELTGKVKEAFHNFDPSFTGLDRIDVKHRPGQPQ